MADLSAKKVLGQNGADYSPKARTSGRRRVRAAGFILPPPFLMRALTG